MICRLATCDDANEIIREVIKAIDTNSIPYIYWGNDIACDCDYLFVHSQGDSTIKGILKVRCVKERGEISKEDFLVQRPKDWDKEMEFKKYFIIEKAKRVNIPLMDLKNADGNPKMSNAMREMSFVVWDKFQPF